MGVIGSALGIRWMDPLAALGVAAMVLHMGFGGIADALGQLTDTCDKSVVKAVRQAANRVSGTTKVSGCRARAMGSHWYVEVEVFPDEYVESASAVDNLAARVQYEVLSSVKDASECLVRVRQTPELEADQIAHMVQLQTPREIDVHARKVLDEHLPEVEAVTRTMTHFVSESPSVEVWIKVSPDKTVFECQDIALKARRLLMGEHSNLAWAKVHLAL